LKAPRKPRVRGASLARRKRAHSAGISTMATTTDSAIDAMMVTENCR